jgi:hypothetical protein
MIYLKSFLTGLATFAAVFLAGIVLIGIVWVFSSGGFIGAFDTRLLLFWRLRCWYSPPASLGNTGGCLKKGRFCIMRRGPVNIAPCMLHKGVS